MSLRKTIFLLLFAIAPYPLQATAQDTLTHVLERIHVQETRHFSYRETRTLQLLAEPWQASGDMYTSPQKMVIAQQTPTPVFTVISAERMQHIDKLRQQRTALVIATYATAEDRRRHHPHATVRQRRPWTGPPCTGTDRW